MGVQLGLVLWLGLGEDLDDVRECVDECFDLFAGELVAGLRRSPSWRSRFLTLALSVGDPRCGDGDGVVVVEQGGGSWRVCGRSRRSPARNAASPSWAGT